MKKELKRQGKAKIPGAPVPYDRTTIQPGIVHIGVGNFHRAHEEFYTNQLLGMGGRDEWGISGVALLPAGRAPLQGAEEPGRPLHADSRGRDGKDEFYEIGSLVCLAWGPKEPGKVIEQDRGPPD